MAPMRDSDADDRVTQALVETARRKTCLACVTHNGPDDLPKWCPVHQELCPFRAARDAELMYNSA